MAKEDRLLWLDLEMTGLDPATCAIIEVAAIVTDLDLAPQGEFHAVVFQPQEVMERMDEWCVKTHGASGLTAAVARGEPIADVERKLVAFAQGHFGQSRPVLCGNSIWQDRRFVDAYLPGFAALLHYRMIDVSAYKEIFRRKYSVIFEKKETHRAIDDVRESIAELGHYLSFFKASPSTEA